MQESQRDTQEIGAASTRQEAIPCKTAKYFQHGRTYHYPDSFSWNDTNSTNHRQEKRQEDTHKETSTSKSKNQRTRMKTKRIWKPTIR